MSDAEPLLPAPKKKQMHGLNNQATCICSAVLADAANCGAGKKPAHQSRLNL
jgi:hypothetical protein